MLSILSRAALATSLLVASANAAYYQGTISLTGPGVMSTNTYVDFTTPAGPPDGIVLTGDPSGHTGDFAAYPINSPGRIMDISGLPIPNFLTFAGLLPATANWQLEGLSNPLGGSVTVCDGTETLGDSCVSFAGSPILLTLGQNFVPGQGFVDTTTATLLVSGNIYDSGDISSWNGVFSAQFNGYNPFTISGLSAGSGTPLVTWSANLQVITPEPGSVFLGLTGLVGIVLGSIRRRKA